MSKATRIAYLAHQHEVATTTLAGYRDLANGLSGKRRQTLTAKADRLVKMANAITKEMMTLQG